MVIIFISNWRKTPPGKIRVQEICHAATIPTDYICEIMNKLFIHNEQQCMWHASDKANFVLENIAHSHSLNESER